MPTPMITPSPTPSPTPEPAPTPDIEQVELPDPRESILALREDNPDAVGWLRVTGTQIDNPVVQAEDNEYYLKHSFMREESHHGAIFLDASLPSEALTRHTVIHGHHMRDGSMFRDLVLYKNESFFNENRQIFYETLHYATEWEIFSVYLMKDEDVLPISFASDEAFIEYAESVAARSMFPQALAFSADDILMTLNTCSYEYEGAHTIVCARLVGVY